MVGRGGMSGRRPPGAAVGEQLVRVGRISADQLERAMVHAERLGERVEDALVLTGAIDEQGLLEFLASLYRTQFVSSRKLARAAADALALRLVPKKSARALRCVPIKFDAARRRLFVAAVDPVGDDVENQVRAVARVSDVKAVVALPSAVEAAIRKFYEGDRRAFERLEEESGLIPLGEMMADPAPSGPSVPASGLPPAPFDAQIEGPGGSPDLGPPPSASRRGAPARRAPVPVPGLSTRTPASSLQGAPPPPDFRYGADEVAEGLAALSAPVAGSGGPSWRAFLEAIEALVTLLEREREGLRGHSAHVARLSRRICERLKVPEAERDAIVLAALLHDIGKMASTYHLTAYNVAEYEGHRIQAEKSLETVLRLFEGAELPEVTQQALRHMYERVDGEGFPGRLEGRRIPRGARILALADTYSDLTRHEKNPFRTRMAPREACEALEQHAGRIFDQGMLGALRKVVLGDEVRERLLANRRRVLLLEADREEALALELRLMEHGFDVTLVSEGAEANKVLESGGFDLVVVAIGSGRRAAGNLALVKRVHERGVPVVVLGEPGDSERVDEAFAAGAADFLVKPVSGEVVAAKLRRLLERGAEQGGSGVRGSLREMSLVDVLQVLTHGRKSGRLRVRSGGQQGELLLSEGALFDASFGPHRGEAAVYALVRLEDGEFDLDPSVVPSERRIHASTESLLLEGMRRMDEGIAVDAPGEPSPGMF